MTQPSIALPELLEKGAYADLLRQMVQHVAQRMMQRNAEGICAAAYGERSPDRTTSRNGGKALAAVIPEAYSQDLSTRSGDALVKAMGRTGICGSPASRLIGEIAGRIHAYLAGPIEGDWPYRWIDARYRETPEAGRIVSKAVIVAAAVNTDGVREGLGMAAGPSEKEPFWTELLRLLTRCGLRGVKWPTRSEPSSPSSQP